MTTDLNCVFCAIVRGDEPADLLASWPGEAIAITPRHPVTPGHVLIIPTTHVADFRDRPEVSATTVRAAAEYAQTIPTHVNLITSAGSDATQTVFHLHVHLVPRRPADGLALPWTGQRTLEMPAV